MNQLAIHQDAKGLRAKSCEEEGQNMLNDNMMLFGMAHRKLVAINARDKFIRPGEVRKGRQRAPLGDNLAVRHNAEVSRKRMAVDLDP